MLKAVRIDFQSRLPIVLANYSNRSLVSHSVPMHVMERLYRVSKSRTVAHSANITRTDILPLHPKTTAVLVDSKSFRNRLYARECMTRRHTYAVASLLGHSGPEISLEHYIHTCDILLSLVLSHDESQSQKKPVQIRSAQPRSTVYRWLSNGLEHVPYRMTRNGGLFYAIKPIKSTSETDQAHTSAEKNSTTITSDIFDQVWGMLFQHTFHGRQLDELCREIGISLEAGQRMLNKAIEISERRKEDRFLPC